MHLEHEIEIAASAEVVWGLTMDVERWPEVTPTMTTVERLDEGPLAVGSRARVKQPAQRARTWTVTRLDAPEHYEWTASMGPIRMTGGHHVTADGDGCRNLLTLDLEGFGAGLFGALARRTLAKALRQENEGFKQAAESAAA